MGIGVRRIITWTYRGVAALLTLALLLVNVRLYFPHIEEYGPDHIGPDLPAQLRHIRTALDNGAGEEMQTLFPEGYFFTHALYGLAWVEVGLRLPTSDPLYSQALLEARWALGRVDSSQGRAPFAQGLDPPYGVFYVGWSSRLRGGILKLQPADSRDPVELSRFTEECRRLAEAFDRSPTPFLSAYPGGAWPVDSVVGMAALSLHDSLLPPRFTATRERWLKMALELLDPETGLLPHRVDPLSGTLIDGTRGSSQSVVARFLLEIDPLWGREQYALFRGQFVGIYAGVPGVREYPHGEEGEADVDSGPLIFGVSLSASAVTLGAAQAHGDENLAGPLLNSAEAFGVPLEWGGEKRYGLGLLPVGDAFLAWSKTARPWVAQPVVGSLPEIVPSWWRVPMHVLCAVCVTLLWLPHLRHK